MYWQGNYYYTDSGNCQIRIRKSATLAGLAAQTPQPVWTSYLRGPDGKANIWSPEIHIINGKAYLYFSADPNSDGQQRLYVLEGGSDPMGPYTPGDTGAPNGQIPESLGVWAIDPDVFYGTDGQLYMTWSCATDGIGTPPQSLCLARMSDPFHMGSATVRVASPTESWETRTAPIEEGPLGFTRGPTTYLTYSGSASWTNNDYAAGVLMNTSGDLLNPNAWVKRGPILDHHGSSYGPGSLAFIYSPDESEMWALYHGYDNLTCPSWTCRSIRMQKLTWTADGMPLLGYPVNPSVAQVLPSGDFGIVDGWGDSQSGAAASGQWNIHSSSGVDNLSSPPILSRQQMFRGDPGLFAYTVSAKIHCRAAPGQPSLCGIYGLYMDDANNVQAAIDISAGQFKTRAIVSGVTQPQREIPLPAGFNPDKDHTITVRKTAAHEFVFHLDGAVMDRRVAALAYGQIGVFTEGGSGDFQEVRVADTSFGWGNGFGDAAEGQKRSDTPGAPDGYIQGAWHIGDAATVSSLSAGPGWHTLYEGEPNYGSFSVQVDAQWVNSGAAAADQNYGLMACYDDRDNYAAMWLNPGGSQVSFRFVIAGTAVSQSAPLPSGFDATAYHTMGATKSANEFVFKLDGAEILRTQLPLANGTSGVATWNTRANFRNYTRQPL